MFLLLELLAGIMFFQFNHYQQSVWLTQANAVTGRVLEWEADVLAYMGLKARNAELTERNIALQIEASRLRREARPGGDLLRVHNPGRLPCGRKQRERDL